MMNKTKLVLVSCCAPCSAGAIAQLARGEIAGVDDFIVLFFNPNIWPESEYTKRMNEQIKYCERMGVKYAIGEYDHDAWRAAVRVWKPNPSVAVVVVFVLLTGLNTQKNSHMKMAIMLLHLFLGCRVTKTKTKLMPLATSPRTIYVICRLNGTKICARK